MLYPAVYRYIAKYLANTQSTGLQTARTHKLPNSTVGFGTLSSRCSGTIQLGAREQLRDRSPLSTSTCARCNPDTKSLRDDYSSHVVSTNMVPQVASYVGGAPPFGFRTILAYCVPWARFRSHFETRKEDLCLQSLWALDLQSKGLSHESAVRVQFRLAKKTIRSYSLVIARFVKYCSKNGRDFSPSGSATLPDFFALCLTNLSCLLLFYTLL